MPNERASCGLSIVTGSPSIMSSPASAWKTPEMILISVDLPAPLSPTTACTSSWCRSKPAPRSATTCPKCLWTSRASRSAGRSCSEAIVVEYRRGSGGASSDETVQRSNLRHVQDALHAQVRVTVHGAPVRHMAPLEGHRQRCGLPRGDHLRRVACDREVMGRPTGVLDHEHHAAVSDGLRREHIGEVLRGHPHCRRPRRVEAGGGGTRAGQSEKGRGGGGEKADCHDALLGRW